MWYTGPAMTTDSDRISRLEGIIEQIADTLTALQAGQESLRTEMRNGHAALRAEIQNGDAALRTDMQNGDAALRAEMHESIGGLRTEMYESIGGLRTETHESIGGLRTEMYNQTRMVLMVSVGIWGTVIAGIVAAVVVPILQT